MTSEDFFAESIGNRLKAARLKQGLTPEQVARKLRLPTLVIHAIEAEEWSKLGAPLYIRSHTKAYADLMGVVFDVAEIGTPVAEPALAPMPVTATVSSKFKLSGTTRAALFIGVLILIAVYAWFAWQKYAASAQSALGPEEPQTAAQLPVPVPPAETADAGPLSSDAAVTATPAGEELALPEATTGASAAEGGMLSFELSASCWVEILDTRGRRLESGLLLAGQSRTYPIGQVGRVTFGNANAVQLSMNGTPVALDPFKSANVAKFAVSSDGRIVADAR